MTEINQKEYLKRYLGIGKGSGEKKKKKKPKIKSTGLKIIDDDINVSLSEEIKVDLQGDDEDAPQIVSVIDERPPSLRIDEKTKSLLWKPIGGSDDEKPSEPSIKFEGSMTLSKSSNKNYQEKPRKLGSGDSRNKKRFPDEVKVKQENVSPEHSSNKRYIDDDTSPPRRRRPGPDLTQNSSPVRRKAVSPGNTPDISIVKQERRDSEDNSPPRRRKGNDVSPKRRRNSDDVSPPRKHKQSKVDSDGDISPPRPRRNDDMSPPRRSKKDLSPPRNRKNVSPRRHAKEDLSPRRKDTRNKDNERSQASQRPNKSRDRSNSPKKKKSRWGDRDEEEQEKLKKTLDGKKAGLQNAADLVQETQQLKKKEDELFKNMDASVSGANAATVVRKKNKEVDVEEEERKRKQEQENKEKYDRWGKGLKQVEDVNEKIQNELYEMSKPLARYADDEDLEKYLKDQEREGDPMLQYLRQKKRKKLVEAGIPVKQQYEGDSAPNRFGIRAGCRWDGVDRSNGYEKKWFEAQNSRTASMEESYKWSTEDM